MYRGGYDAPAAQVVHLVFHQGNERRYHNAHTVHGDGRHLKRYRLAAAGRHKSQGVVTLGYACYYVVLNAAKILVTPIFAQYLFEQLFAVVLLSLVSHRRR